MKQISPLWSSKNFHLAKTFRIALRKKYTFKSYLLNMGSSGEQGCIFKAVSIYLEDVDTSEYHKSTRLYKKVKTFFQEFRKSSSPWTLWKDEKMTCRWKSEKLQNINGCYRRCISKDTARHNLQGIQIRRKLILLNR